MVRDPGGNRKPDAALAISNDCFLGGEMMFLYNAAIPTLMGKHPAPLGPREWGDAEAGV
jgi:hypothetical protein